jgi:hypothetical protein
MVRLMSEADVSVELFGGRAKGDLFEKAFDRKIVLVTASGAEKILAAD